jgi:hypothetical protein
MIWEEFRDPPKFGCEKPGPEGPGFWRPDKNLLELKPDFVYRGLLI